MAPLISVIIPVYNPGKHFKKCLDSIVGQTYRNLEIILIDDGSSDGSEKVCDEYAVMDDRIVCIHQQNGGVSKARNAGIAHAHGDYIHFPDSDDYLEPETYEYLIGLIQGHKVDVVNFEFYITYPSHESIHQIAEDRYGLFDGEKVHRIVLSDEPFCWNKFYKRQVIDGLSFRTDIYRGEDSLFSQQALDRAEKVWFDKRPLYHYVQSEESACRGVFRPSQLSAMKLYDAYLPLFREKYPAMHQPLLSMMANLSITLYCNMVADQKSYQEEQKKLFKKYKMFYRELDLKKIDKKRRMKFFVFRYAKSVFCRLHLRKG